MNEHKTSDGVVILFKEFITGKDSRTISRSMLKDVEFGVDGKPTKGFNGNLIDLQEDALISCVVTSVGGDTEGVLEKVLALRSADYDAVLEKAKAIAGLSEEKKTTSFASASA
ncbi:MAG: hypothetical protein Q8Q08_12835 [Candidatus Omnitrophota bacterium]|nr:hypothetical protein [Candidatus Omnitrophota bacterium]